MAKKKKSPKFVTLQSRAGKEQELDVSVVLIHNMSYLDHAAKIALKNEDTKELRKIYKLALDTTDRAITVALHLGEDEDESIIPTGERRTGFEFPEDCGSDLPEDVE